MDKSFEKVVVALQSLPEDERERISAEILERLEDRSQWEDLVHRQVAYDWLKKHAGKAVREYNKIARKLSGGMVNVPFENLLREGNYWKSMEKLPEEVRKKAEKTYAMWRENPKHPALRFKKIHPTQPIYSFRVGVAYRTIGVEAADNRLVWFWVGSFAEFEKAVSGKED